MELVPRRALGRPAITYVRFSGLISSTGAFEHRLGWETDQIAHPPEPDGPFVVDQLDARGDVVGRTRCALIAPACLRLGVDAWSELRAYVPLSDATRRLRLREDDLVRHEMPVAAVPPRLDIPMALLREGVLEARWSADHDRPLLFNVGLVTEYERVFTLARHTEDTRIALDPALVPGGSKCRIAVVATDGLRSASAVSEPFELPSQPPVAHVLLPEDGARFGALEPVGIMGTVLDRGGRALPHDDLIWHVDGAMVARGRALDALPPLPPGQHLIELRHGDAHCSVSISVAEPTAPERAWADAARAADGRDAR